MRNEQTNTLVLKDTAGSYFLLPLETLEQDRVPKEQKAEVEQLIAAGRPDGDDVQGHIFPLLVVAAVAIGLTACDLPHDTLVEVPTWGEYLQQTIDTAERLQRQAGGRPR